MLIDLHMHEMTYSKDSFLKLSQIVEIAKEKGLDGISITDHDSMGLKDYAAEYSEKRDSRFLPVLNITLCREILLLSGLRIIRGNGFRHKSLLIW